MGKVTDPVVFVLGGYLWFFFTIVYNYLSGHVVILIFWSFCLAWLPLELLVGSCAIFGMVWYGFSNWFWCLWSRPRARACLVWLFKLVLMSVVQVTCKSLFGMAFKNWILWLLSIGHVLEHVCYGFPKLVLTANVLVTCYCRECLVWLLFRSRAGLHGGLHEEPERPEPLLHREPLDRGVTQVLHPLLRLSQ